MGIFVHRACNRCPVVSNAVNSSSSHRSRPRHVLTACKTWPQLGAQAQVCHSPPHQQQPCVYGTQNHHCSVAGMLNSSSTLGNLWCVEMIVGVEWHEAAATFWYQNPIFASKTDANKCIQNNKTRIQSLQVNRCNPHCASNVSFSNVVPSSTKPNCKGRLSWGRHT